MNDIEKEVYKDLKSADTDMEILDATEKLNCEPKTATSMALLSMAGTRLGREL